MKKLKLYFLFVLIYSFFNPSYSLDSKSGSLFDFSPNNIEEEINKYKELYAEYVESNPDTALYFVKKVNVLARQANKKEWIASSYWIMADLQYELGYFSDAAYNYFEASKVFDELDDRLKLAHTLNSIGDVYALIKDYRTAISYFEKARHLYVFNGASKNVAMAYRNLASCYLATKEFDNAETALGSAMMAAKDTDDYELICALLNMHGILRFSQGTYDQAREYYQKSIQYSDSVKDNLRLKAVACNNLGETFFKEGKYKEANEQLLKALEIKRGLSEPDADSERHTLNLLAKCYLQEGRTREAISILEQGLAEVNGTNLDKEVGIGLHLMLDALARESQSDDLSANDVSQLFSQFRSYSAKLSVYNQTLDELRVKLEIMTKKFALQLAEEKYEMNQKLASSEAKTNKFRLALWLPGIAVILIGIALFYFMKKFLEYRDVHKKMKYVLDKSKGLKAYYQRLQQEKKRDEQK